MEAVDGRKPSAGARALHWTKGSMNTPTTRKPCSDGSGDESQILFPFGKAVRFPIVGKHPIVASIPVLFLPGSPPAVFRFIPSIGINSIDSVTQRWLSSHIRQEVIKGVSPAVTNADPTASVIFVKLECWQVATVQHCRPRSVLRRLRSSACLSMRGVFDLYAFPPETSARVGFSENKGVVVNHDFVAARALATPSLPPPPANARVIPRNNRKPTKNFPWLRVPSFHCTPRFLARSRIASSNTEAWLNPICLAISDSSDTASLLKRKLVATFLVMLTAYRVSRSKSTTRIFNA